MYDLVSLYPPPEGAPETDEEWDALPEDSPYLEGPEIAELPDLVRDALAEIGEERVAQLAVQWAQIEEFHGYADPEALTTVLRDLRDLAQRAQKEDQMIYCWICL
ncbi:hypothetical protein Acor_52620 [Acrocarpospora corrugata]|uniref:DUF1877 domain-containing protein n=1 Tax=Acrocarpospora corrugata TaxID=35763 RepID=A0A5M3W388_9ACTN|nr:hypothetical protein [Acrocarpospora corrugata]GES03196.1 hypothetical protein Acor_52620 [Acrocarpospora corrugata]